MDSILSPYAYRRTEELAEVRYQESVLDGLIKSRAAIEVAKQAVKAATAEAIERCTAIVNEEMGNVQGDQQKRRARVTEADHAALLSLFMELIDDHYFLPTDLMTREAGDAAEAGE